MDAATRTLDLSVLPPEYRAVFEAQAARVAELETVNRRLEHLVAELNHVVHGRKSEKLGEDDRQLAFEDLEIAVAETRERKRAQAPGEGRPARKIVVRRNRGNLPEGLERTERVIEPDSLECPSPVQRQRSRMRAEMLQRAASSVWFRQVLVCIVLSRCVVGRKMHEAKQGCRRDQSGIRWGIGRTVSIMG